MFRSLSFPCPRPTVNTGPRDGSRPRRRSRPERPKRRTPAATPSPLPSLPAPATHPSRPSKKIVEYSTHLETLVPYRVPNYPREPDLPRETGAPARTTPRPAPRPGPHHAPARTTPRPAPRRGRTRHGTHLASPPPAAPSPEPPAPTPLAPSAIVDRYRRNKKLIIPQSLACDPRMLTGPRPGGAACTREDRHGSTLDPGRPGVTRRPLWDDGIVRQPAEIRTARETVRVPLTLGVPRGSGSRR
jgi:hypothetical protein